LSLAEMLYGLLQAHDSLVLDIDVEVGGIDQLHNCILMRDIFRLEKRDPPFSLLIPLVPGIDGDAKMSTFRKNEIVVTDCEKRIRSRILSIRRPDHIFEYLRMLSDVEEETVSEWEMGFANGNISINKLSQWMADAVLKKMEPWLEPVKSN
jgi:tyrosyl-tRNA synthetase